MIILGIDPGTRRTGFGVIDVTTRIKVLDSGVIRLAESQSLPLRLATLQLELNALFSKYRPPITVIEQIFFGKNADSAFKLGHARGVCLAVAASYGSQVEEYAAKTVKKAITGNGGADKETVRLIVTRLLNYTPESNDMDVSDALALALCHAQSLAVAQQTARALGGQL
jgi:crossover junction endodeoxyribonuclease RuvC